MAIQNNFPSVKPSLSLDFAGSKALDSRITFTRASEGRFYDGRTVAKAEENLLTFSQEFDNAAWNPFGLTITANTAVAPNGTTTADTLNEGTTTGLHNTQQNGFAYVSGTTYTQSVFAKADTATVVQILMQSTAFGVNAFANYDLTNGVLGTVGSSATATITSVGNGWYRCTLTATATSTATQNTGFFCLCDNNTTAARALSYTGTSRQLFLWGAQLEQRSSVTAYTPTTTQPITNYIPVLQTAASGVARFDHNPVTGESLGLLIEEQSTNLLLRSQEFENFVWTKQFSNTSTNAVIAPDGTLTADKLIMQSGVDPAGANSNGFRYVADLSIGTYTYSIYAKAGEFTSLRVREGVSTGHFLDVNLLTGAITNQNTVQFVNPAAVNVGNGWWRVSWTSPSGMTSANKYVFRVTQTGDGFSGIYVWGAQLEAGAFPTSYIPTVAAQVTRSADAASMTGVNFSSWYRQDEGTFYVQGAPRISGYSPLFQIDDGTANNRILVEGGVDAHLFVTASGATQASIDLGATSANVEAKFAAAYKFNDFSGSLNGGVIGSDTTGVLPLVSTARFGANTATSYACHIRKVAYWPARLSAANLQALTTP